MSPFGELGRLPTFIANADVGNDDFPAVAYASYHFRTAVESSIG
jgi:hypothetical protein